MILRCQKQANTLPPRRTCFIAAFSLVELSIVLVILGLLVGGVLAGRNLIEQARIHKTITELNAYRTAVNTFRMRFNGLPGDITNATALFTDVANGDGNGQIQWYDEGLYAWMQLEQAGLITGGNFVGPAVEDPTPGINVPRAAYDDSSGYSLAWEEPVAWQNNFNMTGNVLHLGRHTASNTTKTPVFPPPVAYSIDMKLDDGKPAKGSIRSWDVNWTPDCITASALDAEYQVSIEDVACAPLFQL